MTFIVWYGNVAAPQPMSVSYRFTIKYFMFVNKSNFTKQYFAHGICNNIASINLRISLKQHLTFGICLLRSLRVLHGSLRSARKNK